MGNLGQKCHPEIGLEVPPRCWIRSATQMLVLKVSPRNWYADSPAEAIKNARYGIPIIFWDVVRYCDLKAILAIVAILALRQCKEENWRTNLQEDSNKTRLWTKCYLLIHEMHCLRINKLFQPLNNCMNLKTEFLDTYPDFRNERNEILKEYQWLFCCTWNLKGFLNMSHPNSKHLNRNETQNSTFKSQGSNG